MIIYIVFQNELYDHSRFVSAHQKYNDALLSAKEISKALLKSVLEFNAEAHIKEEDDYTISVWERKESDDDFHSYTNLSIVPYHI
jgi:hypothetical protein